MLATVDEPSYTGGTMGIDHPVAWCKDWKGGRSFYVAGGGTVGAYDDSRFVGHLGGAVLWATGTTDGDCGATVVANYKQTAVTAQPNINEPIGFDTLPDGRVIQTDRRGGVRLHDPAIEHHHRHRELDVYTHSEDGLYGPAIDPDFATNRWVYLYYAPLTQDAPYPTTTPAGAAPTVAADPSTWDAWKGYFQLSRFKFVEAAGRHHPRSTCPASRRSSRSTTTAEPAATSPATSTSTPTATCGWSPATTHRPAAGTRVASARTTTSSPTRPRRCGSTAQRAAASR